MNQKFFKGKIWTGECGENYRTLFIGYNSKPFPEIWDEDFSRKKVTVRYFISDTEKSIEELKENQLLSISGAVNADYSSKYSEYTGYLWTDEELKVGGHDLLNELYSNEGKYLYMEVDY